MRGRCVSMGLWMELVILVILGWEGIVTAQDGKTNATKQATLPHGLNGIEATFHDIVRSVKSVGPQTVDELNVPATLTTADMLREQERWRNSIRSLEVEFIHSHEHKLKSVGDKELENKSRSVLMAYTHKVHYAYDGAKIYSRFEDVTSTKTSQAQKKGGASGKHYRIHIFDGTNTQTFEPGGASGQMRPGRSGGIADHGSWYLEMISIFQGDNASRMRRTERYVPVALGSARFRVYPKLENVDGYPCHVVSDDRSNVYWIDHNHGCCVRRHVAFGLRSPEDGGCLQSVTMCRNFIMADTGVWLPKECQRITYTTFNEPESMRGRVHLVDKLVVRSVEVNKVALSLFQMEFPGGTEVHDLIENKAYFVPHGEGLLEEALAQARPIIDGKVMPRVQGSKVRWIMVVNGVLFCVLVVALGKRYLLRRKSREMH
ncbi:MAG TPA: hypothetical protein VKU02_20455 [Gemmataceae bacterium]|nr:hypothetical protein [Gemmataceae bacterium]